MAKNYDLKLKGYVGGWDFDADYVDWFLTKNKDKEITIMIDSLGGSVVTAFSIAAAIKQHGNVNIHYVGFNASAATIASMNAKHISIDANAMYLVHKCSQLVCKFASCNADEMQRLIDGLEKSKRDMEKIDLTIATMYAGRCKKSKEALLKLMAEGGWLTAKEAKEWGFVDEIVDEVAADATEITDVVAAAMCDEGIPMPPGMGKKPGVLARARQALRDIFTEPQNIILQTMSKILPLICAALSCEELAFEDGTTALTEEQIDTLEAALKQNADKIAELEATIAEQQTQIENLKNQPADETTEVVADGSEISNDVSDFTAMVKHAKEMFDSIP